MSDFTHHSPESAPTRSKPLLQKSEEAYGMIPSLHRVMAESSALLQAYQTLTDLFIDSSLSKIERHVVWLAINVINDCHYCVPAHSMMAKLDGIDDAIVKAIRTNQPIDNERLEALRQYTQSMVSSRGKVSDEETQAMLALGFSRQNLLDIVLGIGHKVMSNYTNSLAKTAIDEPFLPFKKIG